MTPSDADLAQITSAVTRSLEEFRSDVREDLKAHRDEVKEDLERLTTEQRATKEQVMLTNGRVRGLELWKAKVEGYVAGTAPVRQLASAFALAVASAVGGIAFAKFTELL